MSYTVGVKRKFWFGHRKVTVSGHDWQNGRFILNLVDGSQEHIPGFSVPAIKVYNDFWTHLAQIQQTQPVRQGATAFASQVDVTQRPAPQTVAPETVQAQAPVAPEPDPFIDEVRRRATERVHSILAGQSPAPQA